MATDLLSRWSVTAQIRFPRQSPRAGQDKSPGGFNEIIRAALPPQPVAAGKGPGPRGDQCADGKTREEGRKLGTAILGGVSSRIKFDPVAWVVDAAAWNDPAKTLDVLSGDTEFGAIVDVSADAEKNQAVAKEFANRFCRNAPHRE